MRYMIWLRKFLFLLICSIMSHYPLLMAQPSEEDDEVVKFGFKIGYQPGLWSGRGGLSIAKQLPIGIYAEYHFSDLDLGPPPLGIGVQFISFGLQVGLFYSFMDVEGHRRDIDPEGKFLSYGRYQEILSLPFHISKLIMSISCRQYLGKSRKFCFFFSLSPTLILHIYKIDWLGELAERPGYELLKKYLKYGGDAHGTNEVSYDYYNSECKQNRDDFHHKWQKRKAKDKRTSVPIQNVFTSRWQCGIAFGMDYEMDMGLILSWTVVDTCILHPVTFSTAFGIGYNLNKLFKYKVK